MGPSRYDRVLELVREAGVLRARDLAGHGIPREYLIRLQKRGLVNRVGRGLYTLPEADASEHHSLAEVSKRVPHGVICLLSSLRYHGLTTQNPFEVWIAVDARARRPSQDGVPIRVVRFNKATLEAGAEQHRIDGVSVRIFCPAKTVADCFKFRNKVGLDVAMEALRDCRRQLSCTNDELWHYAGICRVANVMRPYLEATT